MKFIIFKRNGEEIGDKLGSYESSFKDDSSTNRSHEMAEPKAIHIEFPEGLDEDCVKPQWMELQPEQTVTLREPIEAVEAVQGQEEIIDMETGEVLQFAIEAVEGVEAQEGLYQTIPAIMGWGLVVDEEKAAAKAAYQAESTKRYVKGVIEAARAFGNDVMNDFSTENVMMGITADGKTGAVRKTMEQVILALTTGSLYDAITEAKAIPEIQKDDKYITDARLLSFVNKIETYLQVPLSTDLE